MRNLIVTLTAIVLFSTLGKAQSNEWDWLVSSGFSYDVTFVDERVINDDVFLYHIEGHNTVWAEIGKQKEKRSITGVFRYGKSILDPSLEEEGGLDGEIEMNNHFMLGANFRHQLKRLKDSDKLTFNSGYRASLLYARYWGKRAFNDSSFETYSRIEDYTINLVGLESSIYLELGKKSDKLGFFLNIEPLYVRVTSDGFGIGAIKTAAKITF